MTFPRRFLQCIAAILLLSSTILFMANPLHASTGIAAASGLQLHQGWKLQSSKKVGDGGEKISSDTYKPVGWHDTVVPATVVAAQLAAGEFKDKDIYYGMNLRQLPGMTYPVGMNNFNRMEMDPNSPYAASWWYRTEFIVPKTYAGKTTWLHFDGINYRANIWLNGEKLADAKDVAGAYRLYEFNTTSLIKPGNKNVLAIEVFAPTQMDLGINWVDWNPAPPDKNMGLWRDVYLTTSGPVSVRYPNVVTHFPGDDLQEADLTIMAQLHNASDGAVTGILHGSLDTQVEVDTTVTLQPGETRTITFTPDQYPQLKVKQPALWWPAEMGTPNLHDLDIHFSIDNVVSDEQHARVGLREVTSELTSQGGRLFRINGKRILIRGGGWSQDMLLREDHQKLDAQFQYVQAMGLNTIRLEAQLETEDFFRIADEKGVLVMAGWCCCDIWERWKRWQPETLHVATESLRTELLRLRSHPSMLVWLNGSDGPPPAEVENAYIQVEHDVAWPNPVLSSASDSPTTVTGASGVKMTGPYDYEPPAYWLLDRSKYGGAWGFNTETGPGPAIPTLDGLRKFLPNDHLWPIDNFWSYHAAGQRFQKLDRFNEAMDKTYGKAETLKDFLRKAQAMDYDGERAMFEAYGRNKYTATGVIQWMLNNAWPSTYWHLYDYYLQPAGGYFGTKKACEPLHVQYSYDDQTVVVVNSRRQAETGLKIAVHVYDFNLKEIFTQQTTLDIDADASKTALTVPAFPNAPANAIYFVKLGLRDSADQEVSSNFYWVPTQVSSLAWDQTPDTAFTPIASFEDLTELNHLPAAQLAVSAISGTETDRDSVHVTLRNSGKALAFQVRVAVHKPGSEEEIVPVLWDDNYISLLPGETKVISAKYLTKGALSPQSSVFVEGWNVSPVKVSLKRLSQK